MKEAEIFSINDGWGVVGYGFECPYCEHVNLFILEDEEEHDCEKCHKTCKSA